MADGHIEFTLSMCVISFVVQNPVQPIMLSCMVGFENNVAQMIIMTRMLQEQEPCCWVKGQGHIRHLTLCIGFDETCSCLTHNIVMHGGI